MAGPPCVLPVQLTVKLGELVQVGSGFMSTVGGLEEIVVEAVAFPAGVRLPKMSMACERKPTGVPLPMPRLLALNWAEVPVTPSSHLMNAPLLT